MSEDDLKAERAAEADGDHPIPSWMTARVDEFTPSEAERTIVNLRKRITEQPHLSAELARLIEGQAIADAAAADVRALSSVKLAWPELGTHGIYRRPLTADERLSDMDDGVVLCLAWFDAGIPGYRDYGQDAHDASDLTAFAEIWAREPISEGSVIAAALARGWAVALSKGSDLFTESRTRTAGYPLRATLTPPDGFSRGDTRRRSEP